MIKFKCPHCGKDVSAGDEHAGKKGRCPGCKELFMIPGGAAAAAPKPAPAPAAERRTPPPPAADDDEEAPPKKKKPAADYDPDDPDAVEELKKRVGAKIVKRRPEEDEEEDEPPRKKKPARDEDEDDEAVAEAPRKKKPARDEDEDDEEPPAKKKRPRDDEDEDDAPRARKKRDRDDEDEDEEDDRPRKKKKGKRGKYADCPNCGARGDAHRIIWTFGLGFLPMFFSTVRCNRCGTQYNGKHGDYNTKRYLIYFAVIFGIFLILFILSALLGGN